MTWIWSVPRLHLNDCPLPWTRHLLFQLQLQISHILLIGGLGPTNPLSVILGVAGNQCKIHKYIVDYCSTLSCNFNAVKDKRIAAG